LFKEFEAETAADADAAAEVAAGVQVIMNDDVALA
jgi:hypothetical protein